MKRSLPAAGLLTLVLGCAPAIAPEEPIDLAAERSALLEADRNWAEAYAVADDKAGGFVSMVLDDARLLPPGAPLASGREAVRAVIEQLESMPGFHVEWVPTTADVSEDATLGYTIGTYQMRFDGADGNPVTDQGKYVTVWRKGPDGSWKVTVDTFNSNVPPPAAQ